MVVLQFGGYKFWRSGMDSPAQDMFQVTGYNEHDNAALEFMNRGEFCLTVVCNGTNCMIR
jgi:hypothetical protein